MDTWQGRMNEPATLHKYLYANADPVNHTDPTGKFSLGSVSAASNINAILTTASVASSAFNFYSAATDEDGLTAKEVGFSILIAAAGPAGGKLIKLLAKGKKAQKTLSVLENAFKAAKNIKQWTPKNKHLLSTASKSKGRFNTDDINQVQNWVAEGSRSPRAMFLPNENLAGTIRVVVDLGQKIGVKGQQRLRIIVGSDGKVINAFPVHVK